MDQRCADTLESGLSWGGLGQARQVKPSQALFQRAHPHPTFPTPSARALCMCTRLASALHVNTSLERSACEHVSRALFCSPAIDGQTQQQRRGGACNILQLSMASKGRYMETE